MDSSYLVSQVLATFKRIVNTDNM